MERSGERIQERVGRTLPSSEEAERALLGAMILDSDRIPEVAELITEDCFHLKRHQSIYAILHSLSESGAPIDFVTIGEGLKARGTYHEVGGMEYITELARSVTSSAHAGYHANLVGDTATLRRLIHESGEMIAEAYETHPDGDSVRNLIDICEQKMFNISRNDGGKGAAPITDAIDDTFRRLDAAANVTGITGLTTGFIDLDQLLCGLNKGELLILAARPSMGKTAFALNLVENAALSHVEGLGRSPSVLLFSLEMGASSLTSRMLCSLAEVDAHRLRTGRVPAEDREKLNDAAERLRHANIFIDDSSSLSIMSLRSRARRIQARYGLDMIVVDYLQLLTAPGAESRLQEISIISRSLKGIARELDVPVVALAQLSRQVELRDPPRPQLSDLRESGSIEQDADVVMMLYRPEYYQKYRDEDNIGLAEVICAKQRNGPTGTVRLAFQGATMRFNNRAPSETEPITL
jgi:replicative DNA helicase